MDNSQQKHKLMYLFKYLTYIIINYQTRTEAQTKNIIF